MQARSFSITRGPAKVAMLSALGVASAAALAWTVFSRGTHPQIQPPVKEETTMIAAGPDPVMVVREDIDNDDRPENLPVPTQGVEEKVATPTTPAPMPPAPLPLAPEPQVVDRSPLGPHASEGGSEVIVSAPPDVEAALLPETPPTPEGKPDPTAPRAAPLVEPLKINVNTAPKAELELLPGIGPALADRIIAARTKKKFANFDDLDKVRGIGPKLLEKIRGRVTFQDPPKGR